MVDLNENDFLVGAAITDGKHDVMLFSAASSGAFSLGRTKRMTVLLISALLRAATIA